AHGSERDGRSLTAACGKNEFVVPLPTCVCGNATGTSRPMQSAATIDRFRSPIVIRALNRFGAMLNGKVSRRIPPEELLETAKRPPLTWEVMEPSPPTNAEKHRRIRRVSQNLACLEWMAPNFRKLHPVGAQLPQECVSLMSPSFLSDQFDTMYNVPGYREWFLQQDLRPSYEFHRRFLQHLQERENARRWILKAPTHMFALLTLLASYPDALFLQTHRAPLKAIASVSSLITILRRVFSDAVDPVEIGAEAIRYWSTTLTKFIGERDSLAPERIFDLSYVELRRDP